jgi:hypothetical protein
MKVNIAGVGLIPKLGLLAPVYGKDLGKDDVNKILSYSSFKVYVAANGAQITRNNIDEVFGATKPVVAEAPKKKATKKSTKKAAEPVNVEAPVVEETPAPVVEETPVVEEADKKPIEEVPADEGFPVDDIVDEDTPAEEETEKPVYTSKKKKRH